MRFCIWLNIIKRENIAYTHIICDLYLVVYNLLNAAYKIWGINNVSHIYGIFILNITNNIIHVSFVICACFERTWTHVDGCVHIYYANPFQTRSVNNIWCLRAVQRQITPSNSNNSFNAICSNAIATFSQSFAISGRIDGRLPLSPRHPRSDTRIV